MYVDRHLEEQSSIWSPSWSRVGSVQQTVRIVGDLDLHAIDFRLTVLPRVGRDLCSCHAREYYD